MQTLTGGGRGGGGAIERLIGIRDPCEKGLGLRLGRSSTLRPKRGRKLMWATALGNFRTERIRTSLRGPSEKANKREGVTRDWGWKRKCTEEMTNK